MKNDDGIRARKKAQTHRALADAARVCFAEKGFDATTMAEVARAAGVSEQTVYNYFPTKEALVFDRDDEVRAHVVAFADAPEGLIEATRAFAGAALDRIKTFDGRSFEGGLLALVVEHPRLRGEFLVRLEGHADALATALAGKKAPSPSERIRAAAVVAVLALLFDVLGKEFTAGRTGAQAAAAARKMVDQALKTLAAGIA